MKLWPWSELARLREETALQKARLEVCGLAAVGAYNGLVSIDNPITYSASLVEVMALRKRYEKMIDSTLAQRLKELGL